MYSLPRRSRLVWRRFSLVSRSRDSFRKSRNLAFAVHARSRRQSQSTQLNHINLAMSHSHGTSFRTGARNIAQRWLRGQNFRWRGCRRGCREQSFTQPTDGLRRVTEVEPPGCYVFHERCRTRRYACVLAWSPEVPSCVRCVLTQCVLCACVHRVQWQRRSTSSVNRHAAGRAAVLQLPGQQLVCVGQHLPLRYKVRSPAL